MKPKVTVTDHALVRFLERVGGFDLEQLRREIAERVEPAATAGASTVTIDGFAYRIGQNNETGPVVVTVLPVGLYRKMRPSEVRKARASRKAAVE